MVDRPQIDLMAVVRNFVANATGLALDHVIIGNQSSPAPSGEYATVLTLTVAADGLDWNKFIETDPGSGDGELTADTMGNREAEFSVQFFRTNVMENARNVLQYAKTPNGQFFLQQNKMAWRQESPASQADSVVPGNTWEDRAAITLNFGFIETNTPQQINALTSQEITIEYSGETDIEEIINVSTS